MSEHNGSKVGLGVGLLDLPNEILALIVRWMLQGPRATQDIAAVRASCARLNALSCLPWLETGDVDPLLAPFACYEDDEYDPACTRDDGRLISAVGLMRAPRLCRQFVQTCVRYAIYSLIASEPDVMAPQLDLVPFSSFARPESTALLMARALKPVRGLFVYNHIKVYTHSDGQTNVRACCGTTAKILDPEPAVLDEWSRDTINDALVAAAKRAMDATGLLCEYKIVTDSIDLFEAYPDCVGSFHATHPGLRCTAGWGRYLTRKCTVDISSAVDRECCGSARATATSPCRPCT
ncbi:hypothetical protein psal_cds_841 [Pandoravirus salinus]|uniref:Uncharacterized protein n=1 Tax=Pandoravirus salinus TaxID=1349410 RepID=S4VZF0_9VIRU|nr:hypothetical protein psal_cds_841 [Pandoravirus salinus]AGO84886.1 hypothetical protein psal_cds_841 [Pandoravirus salinus]